MEGAPTPYQTRGGGEGGHRGVAGIWRDFSRVELSEANPSNDGMTLQSTSDLFPLLLIFPDLQLYHLTF
jgi:hypothetical protein